MTVAGSSARPTVRSEGLDCEFVVVDGQYAKRKLWQLFTLQGTTPGTRRRPARSRATPSGRSLECARGIRPDDKSEAAQAARKVSGWQDFDQLRFIARLGVRPPRDGYAAKNTIVEVITPDRQAWKKPEQIDRDLLGKPTVGGATAPRQRRRRMRSRGRNGRGESMGEISQREDEWQRKAPPPPSPARARSPLAATGR